MKNRKKIVLILVFVLAALSGCGLLSSDNKLPDATFKLNKTVYQKGEKLSGVFTVTNNTGNDIDFRFGSGCQYGLRISNKGGITFEYPFSCPAVLSYLNLKNGQKNDYTVNVFLRDENNQLLDKGNYKIAAYLIGEENITANADFEIK